MKNKLALVVAIAALVIAGFALFSPAEVVTSVPIGASEDGDSNFTNLVTSGNATIGGYLTAKALTQGGGVWSSSTAATATVLPASAFDTENLIDFTPNGASLAITLPASSTLTSFIPNTGDTRTVFVRNATSTANVNITIVGGTGTVLKKASSTSTFTIVGDTDHSNLGIIEFVRKANTDIIANFRAYND